MKVHMKGLGAMNEDILSIWMPKYSQAVDFQDGFLEFLFFRFLLFFVFLELC